MKRLISVLLLLLFSAYIGCVHATAQQSDILIVDGEEQSLYTNPLDAWLRENPEIDLNRLKKNIDGEIVCFSSGNWRGYVATFAIENARLMLKKVETIGCIGQEGADVLLTLFDGNKEVLADWFSGILVVPVGELVQYVHLGYGSLYSEYRLFRIEAGRVVDDTKMDAEQYEKYRQRQFEVHKKTARYFQGLADFMKEDSEDRDDAESFLYSIDSEYTTEIMLPFTSASNP